MYIDLIILLVLLGLVLFFFRRFSSFVYAVAIIDISLRILTFLKYNTVPEIKALIGKYLPESVAGIIGHYTSGIFYTICIWLYVVIMTTFLVYIINHFIHKRK